MLFYLPIFRRTREQHEQSIQGRIDRRIKDIEAKTGLPVPRRLADSIIDRIERDSGRSWEQNDAVGWIAVQRGLRGFSFSAAQSVPAVPRKPARYFERIPWEQYPPAHVISFATCRTTAAVVKRFESICQNIVREGRFMGCFVDLSQIVEISNFVDWIGLISSDDMPT